jgi:plastocyanin
MVKDRRLARAAIGVLALAGIALAGCGSDSKSADTTAAAATTKAAAAATTTAATTTAAAAATTAGGGATAGGTAITIKDFQFDIPSGLKAGETVTITNEDSTAHTFSDEAGAFSVAADPDEPGELTLPAAGTYTVVCKIHQGMQGTMTVG